MGGGNGAAIWITKLDLFKIRGAEPLDCLLGRDKQDRSGATDERVIVKRPAPPVGDVHFILSV